MPTLWTVVFRCYNCDGKFTVRHLSLDRIAEICLVSPCPHCSIASHIAPSPSYSEESRLHHVVYLREETETTYRKSQHGDTWHFNESCSKWPYHNYVELEFLPTTEEVCNECRASQVKHPD
jgi:hypothetical protein